MQHLNPLPQTTINQLCLIGQRLYMLHMLLLPFLPIVALIVQNSMNLHDMLEYRRESAAIGLKVDGTTALGIRMIKLTLIL